MTTSGSGLFETEDDEFKLILGRGGLMEKEAYVYIMSSSFKKLYIGVTTQIEVRVSQHKRAASPDSHTARYVIDKLVYFERFTSIGAAINREKQLKGWLRIRKLELIISTNPTWLDLSADWGKPIEPYSSPASVEIQDSSH
jgi:putative endonuclease